MNRKHKAYLKITHDKGIERAFALPAAFADFWSMLGFPPPLYLHPALAGLMIAVFNCGVFVLLAEAVRVRYFRVDAASVVEMFSLFALMLPVVWWAYWKTYKTKSFLSDLPPWKEI